MIDISIPKDIREYEPKFMGPFTLRQTICLVIAAVIMIGGVALEKYILGLDKVSFIPPLILAAPPIFMGWGDMIFHMAPEVYLRDVFLRNLRTPKRRIYKSRNYYSSLIEKTEEEPLSKKEKKALKKKRKSMPKELKAYR